MITILQQKKRQPFTDPAHTLSDMVEGWLIASDIHDARRQAHTAGLGQLACELYQIELEPSPGKYQLQTPGFLMLVAS